MTAQVKPGVYMRRGRHAVSAETMQFLLEHENEVEAVYAGLDARADGVRAAMKALDVRAGEFDSLDAALADLTAREADYAARLETLTADEAEVERKAAVLSKAAGDLTALLREDAATETKEN